MVYSFSRFVFVNADAFAFFWQPDDSCSSFFPLIFSFHYTTTHLAFIPIIGNIAIVNGISFY